MHEQEMLQIWGKTVDKTGVKRPLLFHMLDTAGVALAIWESTLQQDGRDYFANAVGLADNPLTACNLIAFWAGFHDIGKAFPQFQEQRKVPNPLKHGRVSSIVIPTILIEEFGYQGALARQLATVLGGHHGIFPRSADLHCIPDSKLGGAVWAAKRQALAKRFHEMLDNPPAHTIKILAQPVAMALAGFISVADWIASNEDFFPFGLEELGTEEYAQRSHERAINALKSMHWSEWIPPDTTQEMHRLFSEVRKHGANDLQQTVAELAARLETPGLVIVEAPMGEGKTEAAMYLADTWAVKLKQRGCYFALPTQATSNQMFGRVREFIDARYSDYAVNLMLLHGHAALSAEFATLKENASRIERFNDIGSDEDAPNNTSPSNIIAADWFTSRKRGLLAPFGVGTVDQILLAVLQTRHVFVRLFGLAHKTVIVDEVHAYDAYMITLLERLLEWLASLRCSVVLLSATLPKERTSALMTAYAKGAGLKSADWSDVLKRNAYPRVMWLCGEEQGAKTVQTSPRSTKNLRIEWVDGSLPESEAETFALGQKLRDVLARGGCAAVICSTVDRAQSVYKALKPFFPAVNAGDGHPELDLFHARYLFKDREEREKRSLLRFGKPGSEVDCGEEGKKPVHRPYRAVLVATQVIEQSLDLDFDLMITDMAPVDLILQRAGRLHRHSRDNRPRILCEPSLWICTPEIGKDGLPTFDSGTEAVYGGEWGHILFRSWLSLNGKSRIDIPQDVEGLIDSVYGETTPPADISLVLHKRWEESHERLRRKRDSYISMAEVNSILPPYYEDDILEDFNRDLEEDNPGAHRTRQALTRPSELPSIRCVCLYQQDSKLRLEPEGSLSIDLGDSPTTDQAVEILRNSLSISHRALVPLLIEREETQSPWRKNPLLRHYRLLCFDEFQTCPLGNYRLYLDTEIGLRVLRIGKESE